MSRELGFANAMNSKNRHIGPAEMLRSAITQFSEDPGQWIKGEFWNGDGGACVLGALATASAGRTVDYRQWGMMQALIVSELQAMYPELTADNIPDLNDDPLVTFEGMLAALEKTAIKFEEGV